MCLVPYRPWGRALARCGPSSHTRCVDGPVARSLSAIREAASSAY